MKVSVLIFGGIGFVLLAIAGLLFLREQSFLNKAEHVMGTVTDLDRSESDGDTSYCPVIDFSTTDGQNVRYHASICSSPPAFDVGDSVKIIYDPSNPKNVQMENFWDEYVAPFVLGVVGLPLFGFGLLRLFSA